eukprot:2094464-Rhodomonas_salina.1
MPKWYNWVALSRSCRSPVLLLASSSTTCPRVEPFVLGAASGTSLYRWDRNSKFLLPLLAG